MSAKCTILQHWPASTHCSTRSTHSSRRNALNALAECLDNAKDDVRWLVSKIKTFKLRFLQSSPHSSSPDSDSSPRCATLDERNNNITTSSASESGVDSLEDGVHYLQTLLSDTHAKCGEMVRRFSQNVVTYRAKTSAQCKHILSSRVHGNLSL